MSMDSSAIAGDSKGVRRDDSAANGRKDSSMVKKLLESGFKVKKNLLVI